MWVRSELSLSRLLGKLAEFRELIHKCHERIEGQLCIALDVDEGRSDQLGRFAINLPYHLNLQRQVED